MSWLERPQSKHQKPGKSRKIVKAPPPQLSATLLLTRVKAFDDCCCVDEISSTQHAHEVWVELSDLYSGCAMHFGRTRGKGEGEDLHGKKREEGVKRQKTTALFGEDLGLFGFVEATIIFYADSATNNCGRFTVSSDLEPRIIANQSHPIDRFLSLG